MTSPNSNDGESVRHLLKLFVAPELHAWRGAQPLWKVFWLYGVAFSSSMIAVYVIAFFAEHVALRQMLLLAFVPYTTWLLVAIWRCADNTHERLWSMLARLLTVAWACNTTLVVVFLQLNLIPDIISSTS